VATSSFVFVIGQFPRECPRPAPPTSPSRLYRDCFRRNSPSPFTTPTPPLPTSQTDYIWNPLVSSLFCFPLVVHPLHSLLSSYSGAHGSKRSSSLLFILLSSYFRRPPAPPLRCLSPLFASSPSVERTGRKFFFCPRTSPPFFVEPSKHFFCSPSPMSGSASFTAAWRTHCFFPPPSYGTPFSCSKVIFKLVLCLLLISFVFLISCTDTTPHRQLYLPSSVFKFFFFPPLFSAHANSWTFDGPSPLFYV